MARSRKPQVLQNEVLARTLARQSKSQIAQEMAIDRQTVTRIQECHNLPQLLADSRRFIVENVVPDAIHSLHAQIIDRDAPGDGDLAARLLERSGVLDGGSAPTFNICEDKRLQMALALLPPLPNNQNAMPSASGVEGATPSHCLNGGSTDAPPPAGANHASLGVGAALTVEAEPVPVLSSPVSVLLPTATRTPTSPSAPASKQRPSPPPISNCALVVPCYGVARQTPARSKIGCH